MLLFVYLSPAAHREDWVFNFFCRLVTLANLPTLGMPWLRGIMYGSNLFFIPSFPLRTADMEQFLIGGLCDEDNFLVSFGHKLVKVKKGHGLWVLNSSTAAGVHLSAHLHAHLPV